MEKFIPTEQAFCQGDITDHSHRKWLSEAAQNSDLTCVYDAGWKYAIY